MSVLEVRNLKKSFDAHTVVLRGVDFSLEKGETIAIIGSSGSGKTTLLRCLNFLTVPDEGQIAVNGETLFDAADPNTQKESEIRRKRLHFGLVFQNFNLFPQYTARQNVMLASELLAKEQPDYKARKKQIHAQIAAHAEELLTQVGLKEKMDLYPHQLSGGQQQRVAIARALVTEPAIICLDEPLSNLDAKLRVQLRLELKKMQKDFGITSIYVTHDQEEALTLSDRIAVFNKGVIEQIGTPNEIYNHSATEFVCNFIGDINRLSDDIVEKLNAKGAQLDPTHHHYIRLERVHVNDARHAESGAVSLSGTVESREYYGLYIKYYINVGSQTLKVIERNDGVHLHDTGDAVTVTVHPDDLMSYAPNGEEAEK